MDLLSQMLDLVRLRGELVFSLDLAQPWSLRFRPGSAYFFVVLEGELTVEVAGEPSVTVIAGDLVMLPRGAGFILTDGRDAMPANAEELMDAQFTEERFGLHHGGAGSRTRLIGGAFHFESTAVPWVVSALR